jgi:DNA-binding NtrC family response regulator
LREGDLFGWRRGAFTGAQTDHRGRVTQAEGGTLFIDEIDKLDLTAQGKLLRLLEERRYTVLGEDRERRADTRFIVGTNANLEAEVAGGRFLEDLYYRVNVLPVEVPPLRSRSDEIPGWTRHMAAAIEVRGGPAAELTPDALALLVSQPWPGNLRQLQSVMVRAVALAAAGARGPVVVGAEPVLRALGMDLRHTAGPEPGLPGALREAAAAFLRENTQRRTQELAPLDLELVQALRGAVLVSAVQGAGGDARRAFVELGLEGRLQGGNHLRSLRREQERLVELCGVLGVPVPADWAIAD